MSADPTLIVNGKFVGTITEPDWKSYVERQYPNASYEIKDGYLIHVTVKQLSAFQRLSRDLEEANKAACIASGVSDDGGTANLDSAFLRLKGWREMKVLEAIKKAGLYCRSKRRWLGEGYMLSPTSGGQGNKRAKAVHVMADKLKELGWDVIVYHQMD